MLRDVSNISLPDSWSDWELLSLTGEGAYASVFKARNSAGELSAIKIIECQGEAEAAEAEILMELSRAPGIVQIQDYYISSSDFRLYIRMEYLTDLKTWVRDHDFTEEEALSMMMDLCIGLESCEKAGVLHRDIKPENILVTEDGHARLGDFGVSRLFFQTASSMTVQGTFAYMAPEVYHGRKYDHRADIYSLGLVFYQLLNGGALPFMEPENAVVPESDKKREMALNQRMKGQLFPKPVAASASFAMILFRCCAFHPYNRYKSAAALGEALADYRTKIERTGISGDRSGSFSAGFLHRVGSIFSIVWIRSGRLARLAAAAFLLLLLTGAAYGIWARTPVVDREPCGDGVVWTLYHDGTLVVSGQGIMRSLNSMEDYAELTYEGGKYDIRLFDYISEIKKIIVKKGVRYVCFNIPMPELREVTLSETVAGMSDMSFSDCTRLVRVSFLGEDAALGAGAFDRCTSLREMDLPDHLTEIPDFFMDDCRSLEELTIPKTVRRIGGEAFIDTPWDKGLRESPGDCVMVNDILYAWKGKGKDLVISPDMGISSIAFRAFCDSEIRSVIVEEGVEDIGKDAFANCRDLEKVVLPEGLKELKPYMFDSCSSLREVYLPESLEIIGDGAFRECIALKELDIPPSVVRVGWQAFEGTLENKRNKDGYKLIDGILISYKGEEKDLVIPEGLGIRGMADDIFERQMQLESLELPEGLEWMGDKACFMCSNLREISWPSSLGHIGRAALAATPWLESQKKKNLFVVVNGMLIDYHGTDSVLHIPDDLPISRIMNSSMENPELQELYIPDQVEELEEEAFSGCRSLCKVHFARPYSEEEISKAFRGTPWFYMREVPETEE